MRTRGVPGVKIATFKVSFTGGVQTDKRLIRKVITKVRHQGYRCRDKGKPAMRPELQWCLCADC